MKQTSGAFILIIFMTILFSKRRYVLRLGFILMLLCIAVSKKASFFIKEKNGKNITFEKSDVPIMIISVVILSGILFLSNKVWVRFLKQLSDMTDYN